jgi:hypothetical protein
MRGATLLAKYGGWELAAAHNSHRYSKEKLSYCYNRYYRSLTEEGGLFWLNMHYLFNLMSDRKLMREYLEAEAAEAEEKE